MNIKENIIELRKICQEIYNEGMGITFCFNSFNK